MRLEALTDRELEVLRLLLVGRGRKQIAGDLGISENTVKSHLEAVYTKLDVGSAFEVLALALRWPALRALLPPRDDT